MEESEVRTILHLRSRFFEMPRHEAIKDFDIYKRADQHARSLSDFYEVCKGLELARNFQFSVLREYVVSARVGSIGDNRLGGWHSYRASKTALNQLIKYVAVEFARNKDPVICILLHPGIVDTDLSKPFQNNVSKDKLFTKEFSVQKLLRITESSNMHDNGKFFPWDGQEIRW